MDKSTVETTRLSPDEMGRRDVPLAAGEPTIDTEALALRRDRLRTASGILLGGFIVMVAIQFMSEEKVWQVHGWALTVILAGLTLLLGSDRALGRQLLGAIELLLIGFTAIWGVGQHYAQLVRFAEQGKRAELLASADGAFYSFLVMTVIYGLVIPNRWQKTAIVVAVLAVFPLAEPFAIQRFSPIVTELAPEIVKPQTLLRNSAFLLIGTMLAVYGAHSLNSLRREVRAAKRIGQYRLERMIGQGGMGEVWEARHAFLARPAGIKLIRIHAFGGGIEDTQTAIRRFEREARSTASLCCPNTIDVFDFGTTADGRLYYAMELLNGINLDDLVRKYGPVGSGRTVSIWRQICRSLAEAHEVGMVHRDIKPANIFLCRLGLEVDFVKVLDFGLVVFPDGQDDDGALTQVGVLGTPAFISPEAVLGKKLDGRSDIYATACVAYWLLTGKYVFEGSAMAMAMAHANEEPCRPSERRSVEIPDRLENLIMRCLSKAADDRPTALELIDELDATGLGDTWTVEQAERWWRLHQD